jgi:hypothetical protein
MLSTRQPPNETSPTVMNVSFIVTGAHVVVRSNCKLAFALIPNADAGVGPVLKVIAPQGPKMTHAARPRTAVVAQSRVRDRLVRKLVAPVIQLATTVTQPCILLGIVGSLCFKVCPRLVVLGDFLSVLSTHWRSGEHFAVSL